MAFVAKGMTNHKALAVLTGIERKLLGYGGDRPVDGERAKEGEGKAMTVAKQVQGLVKEATSLRNLAQGESTNLPLGLRHHG
jgi:hypothetical protein